MIFLAATVSLRLAVTELRFDFDHRAFGVAEAAATPRKRHV
jgi:hypothetical protein